MQKSNPSQFQLSHGFQRSILGNDFQPLDLQYQICSKFMRMASEQLYQRELQLMCNTTKLIEKIQDSVVLKDPSSTQESLTFQTFFEDEDPITTPNRSRLLLRKSQSNASLRRTQSGLNEALRDVQKNCSQKTSLMISNMASQFRKIKQKLAGFENEKESKKLEEQFLASQENLLVMRKRVSDLQKDNKKQAEDIISLRKKITELMETNRSSSIVLSKSSHNLKSATHIGSFEKLKQFLLQKEVHIFKKEKEVKAIEDRIQLQLEQVVTEGACSKCCVMLKKIKQSIMKYRAFIESEVSATEAIYQNYKKIFF